VVLAGGRGTRLGGKNKSLVEVEGITILQRNLDILRPLFSEILLSGWPDDTELPAGINKVPDNFPGKGPLAGIEASMKAAATPYIFVFGGDMPWLSEEIIKGQAAEFLKNPVDVLVPRINDLAEPLHSIYNCSLQSLLETLLMSGDSCAVIDFIGQTRVRYHYLPSSAEAKRAFTNINTPEDLRS
jgi:molybdopterin-guanine dinucleotide biosynthesis protein A